MVFFFQCCGWTGAIILLAGFYLNLSGKWEAVSKNYLGLNAIGSALLNMNAFYFKAYPFLLVNFIWMLISIYKLWKKG